jgi:hypothetical protein
MPSDLSFAFFPTLIVFRAFLSAADKLTISNNIPTSFTEIIYGVLLSDGNLRMNGRHAL